MQHSREPRTFNPTAMNKPPSDNTEYGSKIMDFLMGVGQIDGYSFGDEPKDKRGNFWWRVHLFKHLKSRAKSNEKIVERLRQIKRFIPQDERCEIIALIKDLHSGFGVCTSCNGVVENPEDYNTCFGCQYGEVWE